jgi:anti-sigma B factor antagonist
VWYKAKVAALTASVTIDNSGPEPYTLVKLAGEADVTGTQTLHALLAAEIRKRPGLLIIELSALGFMDSAALQTILRARLALDKEGGRLALVSPSEAVDRVLRLTGADQIVPVYASVAEAATR